MEGWIDELKEECGMDAGAPLAKRKTNDRKEWIATTFGSLILFCYCLMRRMILLLCKG